MSITKLSHFFRSKPLVGALTTIVVAFGLTQITPILSKETQPDREVQMATPVSSPKPRPTPNPPSREDRHPEDRPNPDTPFKERK